MFRKIIHFHENREFSGDLSIFMKFINFQENRVFVNLRFPGKNHEQFHDHE